MTGYLLKSIYKKINPQIDSESNQVAEQELAIELLNQGFGVWAVHLDQASKNS